MGAGISTESRLPAYLSKPPARRSLYFPQPSPPLPPPQPQWKPCYAPPPPPPPQQSATAGRVTAFHSSAKWKAYFEASKSSNKLIVIDFTAVWCGPCRKMEPTFNELAARFTDVDFVKIDVDELADVARQFGVQVMPTFLFIKRGEQVDKIVGAKKEELKKKVEKYRDTTTFY